MGKLVVFDGNAVLHRAYHALPPLKTKQGEPINAVYGMISMLIRVLSEFKPTHVAFAFDRQEQTFRNKLFSAYQAQRPEVEDNLASQFSKARDVLSAMSVPFYDKAGYEADDVIGTLAKKASSKMEVVIVTGDRDQFQLVNKKVKVFMPAGGLTGGKLFGEAEVIEKMGVAPNLIVDYKGLVGDPSDNYPGVVGIGPKTATVLLQKFGSFPGIYKNLNKIGGRVQEKLTHGKKQGELSFKIAKIVEDGPFDFDFDAMAKWQIASPQAVELFTHYGFKTLTQRTIDYQNGSQEIGRQILKVGTGKLKSEFKKNITKKDIQRVALEIAKRLRGKQWAVRGTASMVLQELDMGVDDVDILCDKEAALAINKLFAKELVQKVDYSVSDIFKSYFGKFTLSGILVEVMGEWQIKLAENSKKGPAEWSPKYSAQKSEVAKLSISGVTVPVTKLEFELTCSAQMGRWSEYHKIKKQITEKSQQKLF